MVKRQIGDWQIVSGSGEDYVLQHGEDGPYTARVQVIFVEARHRRGMIFRHDVTTEELGDELVRSLPADFDANTDDRFWFVRKVYGSAGWDAEDELALDSFLAALRL